jgi:NAD+-dependent farnesol dehydrogenase
MRILVTGATGYLGRAIVNAARTRGHDTVAFARHATTAGLPCETRDGDVRDRAAIESAAQGCDAVCHTAALVAVWRRRRADFDEVNVGGLQNVIDVVNRLQVRRAVYTSSFLALPPKGAVVPGDWNDYQRTKAAADRLAAEAVARGTPLIRLYPGVIYGPGRMTEGNLLGRMISDHMAGKLPGMIGADRIWSFAAVEDVAAAHIAALERGTPGAAYHLGGENARQIAPFEILRDIKGHALPRRIPGWIARAAALVEEGLARTFGRTPQLTRGTVAILEHDWPLGHESAARDLGYQIRPLRDGVRNLLASMELGQV